VFSDCKTTTWVKSGIQPYAAAGSHLVALGLHARFGAAPGSGGGGGGGKGLLALMRVAPGLRRQDGGGGGGSRSKVGLYTLNPVSHT
jgi:hypothetical protein